MAIADELALQSPQLVGFVFAFSAGSRPTYILGHAYSHGVWFYFPALFILKSPLAFLLCGCRADAERPRRLQARVHRRGGRAQVQQVARGSGVTFTAVVVSYQP